MSRVACRYAIIRFMPYVETGEFANVGIVLACPATGFFGFKLQDRRYRRVTQFFEHIEARDYTQALRLFRDELNRIQDLPALCVACLNVWCIRARRSFSLVRPGPSWRTTLPRS